MGRLGWKSSPIKEEKTARPGNPPESTIALWIRVLLIFVAFGSFALLAGDWVNATFSLWSRSIFVDFTHAELEAPGVYKIQLTVPVDHNRIFSSQIRLLDAHQDKFSYTPRTNSLFANGQGLFTIQKKRSLLIAWPSSQMELPSKGEGVLTFPVLFQPWIIGVAFFLLGGSSVALFCCLPFPTRKVKVLAQRSVALAAWSLRMLGRHPLIVLSLPSAYLLAVYPPLWKDVDALGQLIFPADVTNIYHFPALFCFSARLIVWLGDFFLTWKSPDLLALQKPTLQGIYTLVVAQHLALVLSLGLLCKTLTNRDRLRGVFVVGFFFASSVYTSVLLFGSEAWSIWATISLFAFGLRLYSAQGSEPINWIGYGFSLVLAIGSRHINLLLGFWLIGLCLTVSIIRLRLGQQSGLPSRPLLKAGLALILLAVAVCSNTFLELYLATRVGVEPRTTLGRTLSDRIDSFLTHIKPAERAGLAEELTATTSDRNVRLAIQDQATIGSFYKGTSAILDEQLRAEGFTGEHLQAEKDRVILKATLIYLKTLHPVLVRVIWKDFLRGFTETSNFSLAIDPFAENSYVGKYRLDNPDMWIPLDVLSSTFLPESVAWLDRSVTDVYLKGRSIKGFRLTHLSSTLFFTLLSLGLCFWNRWGVYRRAIPALAILLTGIGVFAATMICVYFMTRYALPLWISVLIALALAIEGLFEGIETRSHKEAGLRSPPP
jgi:hypothetical protein